MLPDMPREIVPEFYDLGNLSSMVTGAWLDMYQKRAEATRYFSGKVFLERVDTENLEDAPLLFPIGINLVKMMVMAMTDAFLGEFETVDDAVNFVPGKSRDVTEAARLASKQCALILETSNAASMLWEVDFDRNLYGAGVIRVLPENTKPGHIRWVRTPIEAAYPIFDPEDPDVLLECYILTTVSSEQARLKYGTIVETDGLVRKVEHWTPSVYETTINGIHVDAYSGTNPWGVVPVVYIPRVRTMDWFGESMIEDLKASQDEMNMRLADAADALNVNTHPVRWGINLPKEFNATNFPIDVNAMWNLGRQVNKDMKPEVGMLQTTNPVPKELFDYVNFIYNWARTSSFAPPIAFGEDNGGGQRSGATLEIRLWPLLKAMRRSRAYMAAGLQRAVYISGLMLAQRQYPDVPTEAIKGMLTGMVAPRFNAILPRDQKSAVDEVIKLMSTAVPSISLETAQEILGRGPSEVTRIQAFLKEFSEQLDPKPPVSGAGNSTKDVKDGNFKKNSEDKTGDD